MNYLIFTPVLEFLIIFITFGLGLFVNKLLKLNERNENFNFSEICLYGFCLILIIAQIINLFSPIKEIFYWLFFLLSFVSIYIEKFKFVDLKLWFSRILFLTLILLPMKLVVKGNEDLYYHLPKINLLNNYKIILGIGNYYESFAFTNGWSHIGAFFNFLNGAEKNLYIVSFVFFILSIDTFYQYFKKSQNVSLKIFSIISLLFLGLKFYRLQEFGNDYQAIILIFLIFFLYLQYLFTNTKIINQDNLIKKIIFFSIFASLFKIHAALVIIFFFIFVFLKINFFKKKFIKFYLILSFFVSLTFITSFLNSGCFLFPFKKTCADSKTISWSIKNDIDKINLSLEAFNKSYPIYLRENREKAMSKKEWITNFNWYLFHFSNEQIYISLSKTILILIGLFFLFAKYTKIQFKKISKNNLFFFLISIFVIILWSVKIPLMRASGYAYISCSLLFLFSSIIKGAKIEYINGLSKKLLLLLIVFIFTLNISRIFKEFKKYNTNDFYYFTYQYKPNKKNNFYDNFNLKYSNKIKDANNNYIIID